MTRAGFGVRSAKELHKFLPIIAQEDFRFVSGTLEWGPIVRDPVTQKCKNDSLNILSGRGTGCEPACKNKKVTVEIPIGWWINLVVAGAQVGLPTKQPDVLKLPSQSKAI